MRWSESASQQEQYRAELVALGDDPTGLAAYLSARSNLPGPRGNLALAGVFADLGASESVVAELAASDDEFLAMCGVLARGERLAQGQDKGLVAVLHEHARDPRWRVREGVAMGLQRVGDRAPGRLVSIARAWSRDEDPLVQRAACAAICEPRLLTGEVATAALEVCRTCTDTVAALPAERRREPGVRVLRQALGYCWSVAVAADPVQGLPAFATLAGSTDPDVAWIERENLKKARLRRVLPPAG